MVKQILKRTADGFADRFVPTRSVGEGKKGTTSLAFIFLAMVVNYWIDRKSSGGFLGFDFTYFNAIIFGGDWFTLYNVLHFNIFFLILVFALFNLRGRDPHILRVWLSLILILYLLSAIPVLNTYMGIKSGLELLLLLLSAFHLSFYYTTKEDFISTVVLFWVFYNLWMFGIASVGFLSGLAHFLYVVLFYIIFCTGSKYQADRVKIKWWLLIIILFDFFLPQLLANAFPNLPIDALPFLTLGTIFFAQAYEPSTLTVFMIIGFTAFYFFQLASATDQYNLILPGRNVDPDQVENRTEVIKFWKWIPERVREWTDRSVKLGAGHDYYAGQVDENAKKNLGVYLEGLDDNTRLHFDNERIVLDATLTAQNFAAEEEDPFYESLNIEVECSAYKGDEFVLKGKVYPQQVYQIESFDIENLQCIFDPWQLDKGRYTIRFEATFNFKTQSYLKRYFVSEELIDSLRRRQLIQQDIDILKLNKINEIKPKVQNSVGPVQVKASDRIPSVIKIDSSQDRKQLFGIQLFNEWEGDIKRVKDIQLYLPKGIVLDKAEGNVNHCTYRMEPASILDPENFADYTGYKLQDITHPDLKNIERDIRQTCGLLLEKGQAQNILQPGDVTTRYFRMITEYEYTLKEETAIDIREPIDFRVEILSSDGKQVQSDKAIECVAKDGKRLEGNADFALYINDVKISEESNACSEDPYECRQFFSYRPSKGDVIKCEATMGIPGEENYENAESYVTVQNAPPEIASLAFEYQQYNKGDNAVCTVQVQDPDKDIITVRFDYEGIYLAPTQKECNQKCSIEIPTQDIDTDSTITCKARAYDGTDSSNEHTASSSIVIPQAQI